MAQQLLADGANAGWPEPFAGAHPAHDQVGAGVDGRPKDPLGHVGCINAPGVDGEGIATALPNKRAELAPELIEAGLLLNNRGKHLGAREPVAAPGEVPGGEDRRQAGPRPEAQLGG